MTTQKFMVLGLSLMVVFPAWAAEEAAKPWATGVSPERQQKAMVLFREGNAALKESLSLAAANAYREALSAWAHPAIHFNLALALTNLDEPVEAHEHLTAAIAFGPDPLNEGMYARAQLELAASEKKLARIKVSCTVAGAQVRLDGRALFLAPGAWSGWVRPGSHTLTASKDGLIPDERSMLLLATDSKSFELTAYKSEELLEYRRAYSPAIPLIVLGAGAAMVGGGVALHLLSRGAFSQFDRGVTDCAANNMVNKGCNLTPELSRARQSANDLQNGAFALYAVGGGVMATSAVLFYLGRPVAHRKTTRLEASNITFAPLLTPSVAGATAAFEF